jgi:hypothetical protein
VTGLSVTCLSMAVLPVTGRSVTGGP